MLGHLYVGAYAHARRPPLFYYHELEINWQGFIQLTRGTTLESPCKTRLLLTFLLLSWFDIPYTVTALIPLPDGSRAKLEGDRVHTRGTMVRDVTTKANKENGGAPSWHHKIRTICPRSRVRKYSNMQRNVRKTATTVPAPSSSPPCSTL